MNLTCLDEPISYLRLERYLQDDIDDAERARVSTHLHACAACRTCYEGLRDEPIALLPLSLPSRVPVPRQRDSWTAAAAAAAAARRAWPQLTAAALSIAALLVIWLRGPELDHPRLPPARVHIKGGELALALVREHAGTLATEPTRFVAGDRFQVRVSCPPGEALYWDVLVLQGGEAFFPLTPRARLQCGNGITLPGAFQLDGAEPASVCVAVQPAAALDRARVVREGARALPTTTACVELSAAPAEPN
jgi:hypothetical protein